LNEFTIAAWVKLDTRATWSRVLDFGSGTGTYMFLTPASYGGNTVRYAITRRSNGEEEQINTAMVLATGVWHHVAVTLSGSVGTLYINGAPAGINNNMTLCPSTLGNTTANYIGKSQWNDPNLTGAIDDFRIYNRGLSAAEITALIFPPAAPAILSANAGDGQVTLTWSASANAASYNVKRATGQTGPYTAVTNAIGTNFVNTGLVNGVLYYFAVSALNTAGESADSVPASARPVSALPTQLEIAADAGQMRLGWPQDHTGWLLQAQTNTPGVGIGTNWLTLQDSDQTNQFWFPFDTSIGSVFFRLVSPY